MSKTITRQSKPVVRTIRLERTPTASRSGKIVITENGKATTYLLTHLDSQMGGICWQLDKIENLADDRGNVTMRVSERYHVMLNGTDSNCDCLGCLRWGHRKPCRHIAGLMKLHADGKLS